VKYLSWLEDLNDRGVRIYSVEENMWYEEKKLDFIQGIVDANKESHMLSKRIRASIQHRRERGDECLGQVPFGKKLVWSQKKGCRVIVENPEEVKIMKEINKMAVRDCFGKDQIARVLNERGYRKRGRRWTAKMVGPLMFD
jgi:DNA invertase Pin-like site-specific DNA recombinase